MPVITYKDSVPKMGDIVEPYDHFYQGTVIEIVNAWFVCVDWRRWQNEKHVEMEYVPHINFVRRA